MNKKTVIVELLLDDSPREWEMWPISRKLNAVAHPTALPDLENADRVALMVTRQEKDDAPIELTGFVLSMIQPDNAQHFAVIECNRLGKGHDVKGLLAVVPAEGINRIISKMVPFDEGVDGE